jgi:hypothetical protein
LAFLGRKKRRDHPKKVPVTDVAQKGGLTRDAKKAPFRNEPPGLPRAVQTDTSQDPLQQAKKSPKQPKKMPIFFAADLS